MKNPIHLVIGSGPLGQSTAEALLNRKQRVFILDRSNRQVEVPGAERLKGDVHDTSRVSSLLPEVSVIYQCSQPAYHLWPEEFPALQNSVIRLSQLKSAKLVVAENLYLFGQPKGPISERTEPNPGGRKGETRLRMHQTLQDLSRQGQLNVNVARSSDFYGPRVLNSFMGRDFYLSIFNRKPVHHLGESTKKHSVTYIKDIGETMAVLGLTDQPSGEIFNAPVDQALSLIEILAITESLTKTKILKRKMPPLLLCTLSLFSKELRELKELCPMFEVDYIVDDSKVRKTLGLNPTRFDIGLDSAIRWSFNYLNSY